MRPSAWEQHWTPSAASTPAAYKPLIFSNRCLSSWSNPWPANRKSWLWLMPLMRVAVQHILQMVLVVSIWLTSWSIHQTMILALRAMSPLTAHDRTVHAGCYGHTDDLCPSADMMSISTQSFGNSRSKLVLMNVQLEVVMKMSCWRKGRQLNSTTSAPSHKNRWASGIVKVKSSFLCLFSMRFTELSYGSAHQLLHVQAQCMEL